MILGLNYPNPLRYWSFKLAFQSTKRCFNIRPSLKFVTLSVNGEIWVAELVIGLRRETKYYLCRSEVVLFVKLPSTYLPTLWQYDPKRAWASYFTLLFPGRVYSIFSIPFSSILLPHLPSQSGKSFSIALSFPVSFPTAFLECYLRAIVPHSPAISTGFFP